MKSSVPSQINEFRETIPFPFIVLEIKNEQNTVIK